jgi:hypothetical protein
MRLGLGLGGLFIALVAIIMPLNIGLFVSALALVLAAVAALAGERVCAILVPIVAATNLFLLSPITLAWLTSSSPANGGYLWPFIIVFLIAPVAAVIVNAMGFYAINASVKKPAAPPDAS